MPVNEAINVIEPTTSQVVYNGTVASSTNDSITLPALVRNVSTGRLRKNAGFLSATNLERYTNSWSKLANTNIGNSTTVPHITVDGVGTGDFANYKFDITSGMLLGKTSQTIQGTFDIDGGKNSARGSFDPYLQLYKQSTFTGLFGFLSFPYLELLGNYDDKYPIDAGTNHAYDSFFTYDFNEPGTYVVRVGRYPKDNPIPAGATYKLHVSLENHATNPSLPDGTTFIGDTIVITGGTGKGQEKTVSGFDPLTNKLDIATTWDANPDATSKFAIRETVTGTTSRTDEYTVVLTGAPSSDVTINLVPTETKTYNDALKFDEDQNYGQRTATQITADETSLTFTTSNWSTPRTVTLSGISDNHIDGDASISFPDAKRQVTEIRGPLSINGYEPVGQARNLEDPLMVPGEINLPPPDGTIIDAGDDDNGAFITISGLPTNTDCIEAVDQPAASYAGVDDWTYASLSADQRKICSANQDGDKFPGLPRNNWDYAKNITGFEFTILGDPSVEGLSNNTKYYVVNSTPNTFQLSGTEFGESLDFTLRGWGQQIFSDTASIAVSFADIDTSANNITYPNHGLSDGNRVEYTQGTDTIGGLVDGEEYFVVNSTANTFKLATALSGMAIFFSDAGSGDHLISRVHVVATSGINTATDTITSNGHNLLDGDTINYSHPDAPKFIVSTPTSPEAAPYGDSPHRGVSTDGFVIHFTEPWSKYDINPSDLGRVDGAGNQIDQFFYQDRNANLDVTEDDQVDKLNIHNEDSLATSEATLTRSLFSGLGMGANTTIEGRKFSGGITYNNLETVNVSLGTGSDTLSIESTHSGVTNIDAGQGYANTINILSTHGHTTIATGGAADDVTVGSLAPNALHDNDASIDRIGGLLVVTGNGTNDTLDIQDTVDNDSIANTATLTSTDFTGLDMPQLAEVQEFTVKATGGDFVLKSSDPTADVEPADSVTLTFDPNPVDFSADAATIAVTLNTFYGTTDAILVQRFGDTFHVTFDGTLTGTNMAQLVWDIDHPANTLTQTSDKSIQVNIDTLVAGTDNPTQQNLVIIDVAATSGFYQLNVLGQNTGAIAHDASAADVQIELSAILDPNNVHTDKSHTNNIDVLRSGTAYLLLLQGEYGTGAITITEHSSSLNQPLTITERKDGIHYRDLEMLQIWLSENEDTLNIESTYAGQTNIDTNDAIDIINIQTTTGNLNIDTGSGNDQVNVGTNTPTLGGTLNNILGNINLDGEFGTADTLTIDDSGDTITNSSTLTEMSFSGAGMGGTITYTQFEDLDIYLGLGDDTVDIESIHSITPTELWTASGNDLVNVGANVATVNDINNILTIDAGSGTSDYLHIIDTSDSTANVVDIASDRVSGLGMGSVSQTALTISKGVHFTEFATLEVSTGAGGDDVTVNGPQADHTIVHSSGGVDNIYVNNTLGTLEVEGGNAADTIVITGPLGGNTTVRGNAGDDHVWVNYEDTDPVKFSNTIVQTFLNAVDGFEMTIEGNTGNDIYDIGLAGFGDASINVIEEHDDGSSDSNGSMNIYGSDANDFFLFRLGAVIAYPRALASLAQPEQASVIERVNYDSNLDSGVNVYGRDGEDMFTFDDTSSVITAFGDDGDDTFQVGQMFKSPRDAYANLPEEDWFITTFTTRGYLSNGNSFSTSLYGGDGDDHFVVYHNLATLGLYGENDDDKFTVRAFVELNEEEAKNRLTNINGGQGGDFVEYAVNAPVDIDGGDGFDTMVIIGTEFGDDIVITEIGVYGAGLFVEYRGVESIEIDMAEGNDRFYVFGTPAGVSTNLIGGRGSDTFNVGGIDGLEDPLTVVSNDMRGHTGIINHTISTADENFSNLALSGISANVGDADSPGIMILETGTGTSVAESNNLGLQSIDAYDVILTMAPIENITITITPDPPEEDAFTAGARGIEVRKQGTTTFSDTLQLTFTPANWNISQTVEIQAQADVDQNDISIDVVEGTQNYVIKHTVIQGVDAGDEDAYQFQAYSLKSSTRMPKTLSFASVTLVVTWSMHHGCTKQLSLVE
ncbi:MAG: beta strand repeat-containing protein [Pirellulales bacterium]